MSIKEFMEQLARLLGGISESERQEALDYYNSYFDDAGPENEAAVIQELGSPGKVAAIIKADLADDGGDFGEYTEKGYEDSRVRTEGQMPQTFEKRDCRRDGYRVRGKRNHSNLILIVILVILASPILLGIGGGILGVILGAAGGIFGLVAGLLAGTLGCFLGGVGAVIAGIVKCFTAPVLGLAVIGGGLIMMMIGMLLGLAFVWIAGSFVPWLIRKMISFCQRKMRDRSKGAQKI